VEEQEPKVAAAATERDATRQGEASEPDNASKGYRVCASASAGWAGCRSVRSIALSLVIFNGSALADDKASDPGPATHGGGIVTKASTEATGYADTDHVDIVSPSISASIGDGVAGWSVGGHYLVDVVSAASVDIVSTASKGYHEVRQGGGADATMKMGNLTPGISGVLSSEPDYLSLAGGTTLSLDLMEKNVTPYLGLSYGQDKVGRTDLPRSFWRDKQTMSGQLGVTFVIDRSTIASLQADAIAESGYLAKPYRYVPLFSSAAAATIEPGASIAQVNATRLPERAAEQVPDERHRFALTGRIAQRQDDATLRFDERVYADTWGLLASTTEFRLLADVSRRLTIIWPHLRFHAQNSVTFWQRAYLAQLGDNTRIGVPVIRTGDRELSELVTGTAGGGIRFKFVDDLRQPWTLVFEVDGSYEHYFDAIYISQRLSAFSTVAVETQF
jgi:hypothetical protein